MPKGLQHKGIVRRNKMLYAAVQLFLKNGMKKPQQLRLQEQQEWHHHPFLQRLRIRRRYY